MSESVIEGYLREFFERLTKIEEAQKRNSRMEDEERRNEEEKAKAVIERNKEFIESFKEKMKLMQKALQKTQGVDDYLTTMGGITREESLQLPPKFSIPKADRPKEKDQVNMVMKGLLPVYYNRMFASPIMDFEQLCNSGMRIEDAIDNVQLDKREGKISIAPKTPNVQPNINVVQPNQYQYQHPPQYQNAYPNLSRQGPKLKRHFDPLGTPLSNVFKHMCKRDLIDNDVIPKLKLISKEKKKPIALAGLIMASQKHRDAILEALARKEVPMDTTPEQVLSIMGMTTDEFAIIFTTKDLPPKGGDHNRALYVTIDCLGSKVPKMLVDNGSSINVCPMRTATKIRLTKGQLSPSSLTVRAYDESIRGVIGTFEAECWMHPIGNVPSMVHQKFKLPWKGGVLTILGDGEINAAVIQRRNGRDAQEQATLNENFVKPGEDFPYCGFPEPRGGKPGFEIFFKAQLTLEDKASMEDKEWMKQMDPESYEDKKQEELTRLLKEFPEVFAWLYEDMPGIDPDIVQHRIPTLLEIKPVKQKLCRMKLKWMLKIKEEVIKQLKAGFIKNGRSTFGLKNVDATYQRMATALLHDMIHKEVEVYMEYMIVKSVTKGEHITNLRKFFERIKKYKLRLNLNKCTFRVTAGRLLGHMVSSRGIEVDPIKIKAILEIPPPKTEKEIRGFLGRLQYISRFIARLTTTCEPIFKLLKKGESKEWTKNCQKVFEAVKEYLSNPPVLAPPKLRRPLNLYLSVIEDALGSIAEAQAHPVSTPSAGGCQNGHTEVPLQEARSHREVVKTAHLTGRSEDDLDDDFPDEDVLNIEEKTTWKIYFDGASNQHGYGVGVLLIAPDGVHIPLSAKLNFVATNNVAEYKACTVGLEALLAIDVKEVEIYGNSGLVLAQAQRIWKMKEEHLKPYQAYLE
uniref:RNase H type-1 domain-containing protein n=1 Tax=Fagus sylvatica TaxID=28930 RepID=A0A2N9EGD3_FAGSY